MPSASRPCVISQTTSRGVKSGTSRIKRDRLPRPSPTNSNARRSSSTPPPADTRETSAGRPLPIPSTGCIPRKDESDSGEINAVRGSSTKPLSGRISTPTPRCSQTCRAAFSQGVSSASVGTGTPPAFQKLIPATESNRSSTKRIRSGNSR